MFAKRLPLLECTRVAVGAVGRRRGRHGLLFVDGRLDFRHPGNTVLMRAVAGEDLAVVTGRGLAALTDIEGLGPYVRDDDVWALGDREHDPAEADIHETGIHVVELAAMRTLGGPGRAVGRAIDCLGGNGVDGFWIHLDADVLESALMPAVDSPQPDGLTFGQLSEVVRAAFASRLAVGMEITIFDPDLDADGSLAKNLTDALVKGIAGA